MTVQRSIEESKKKEKRARKARMLADEDLKARIRAKRAVFLDGNATKEQAAIVLIEMMDEGFMRRTTFVENDPGGREMAINEGKRQLCMMFMHGLNLTEEQTCELRKTATAALKPEVADEHEGETEDGGVA